MVLQINHNPAALRTHRNLVNANLSLEKSLEHLSSGMKINRGADGPASLIISEHMRAQIAGLRQAVKNSETAISLVQTTEANLAEVNQLLVGMRQLAVHASNEAVNDSTMLEADQIEFDNALGSINRIADGAEFGRKKLLDGSTGVDGGTVGKNLEFLGATMDSQSSSVTGYDIRVDSLATRSFVKGSEELSQDVIDEGETLTVIQNGKTASYTTQASESADNVAKNLSSRVKAAGMDLTVSLDTDQHLQIISNQYGSNHDFQIQSSSDGILSKEGNVMDFALSGEDIVGTINNERAIGKGRELIGAHDNPNTNGIHIRYTGSGYDYDDTEDGLVGKVFIAENALRFQIGSNYGQIARVALQNTHSKSLGRGVSTDSNYHSLDDIDLTTFQGAQDAIKILDKSVGEISLIRGQLGAVQKNSLESNLRSLRVATESMVSAESTIRDADMAEEMATLMRDQIMEQTSTSMLKKAINMPGSILTLLDS